MEENQLPPGFRFHPTDEELITYYLTSKVSDYEFTTKAVADVDLNKSEPWDLPGKASMGEKEWYFFSLRDRKYPTGLRTNRATEAGYWKTTGKDKEIFRGGSGALVGMKKTLVFYRGRAPKGQKTNWVMHEYRLQNTLPFKPAKDEWVVCRVFQKSSIIKRPHQTVSSPADESACDAAAMASELSDIELQNFSMPISPSTNNMMALQHYNSDHANMMTMMNWNEPNSLTWPLLSTNLSMNSLLLTALQLRGHHHQLPRTSPAPPLAENYSFIPQGNMVHQFRNDFNMASTSGVVDSAPQLPLEEQHFNVDSNIW